MTSPSKFGFREVEPGVWESPGGSIRMFSGGNPKRRSLLDRLRLWLFYLALAAVEDSCIAGK